MTDVNLGREYRCLRKDALGCASMSALACGTHCSLFGVFCSHRGSWRRRLQLHLCSSSSQHLSSSQRLSSCPLGLAKPLGRPPFRRLKVCSQGWI